MPKAKRTETYQDGTFVFPVRRPDVAYRDCRLWLPKSKINTSALKAAMTIALDDQELLLWEESAHHLIIPREGFNVSLLDLDDELQVDTPDFEQVRFTDKMTPRDQAQKDAWRDFESQENGVLNLACGLGKTALGLKKIASRGVPALVVVNQEGLMQQWIEEAKTFLDLDPEDIGIVRQKTFDWKKPLTIAMIHTLAGQSKYLYWPREFRRYFGTIIFDEVHHLSAPTFARTAPLFIGNRYGLTATPEREDRTEFVYMSHLGPVFHSNMEQPLTPKIYFQRLPTPIGGKDRAVLDRTGEFNISLYRKALAFDAARIDHITREVAEAYKHGRRILVLSHIVRGAELLAEALPGAVVVTGKIKAGERQGIFKENRLVVATMNVAAEFLNIPDMDTVYFTTPFGNWGGLVQGMGRVLRVKQGKKTPVVMIFEDYASGPARALCHRLRRSLRENGYQWKALPYPSESD